MGYKFRAFSLIEMAIVLIIMGLIGGLALPSLKTMLDWQKAKITADRQEKILYTLATYAIQNKILPYAADPSKATGIQDKEGRRRRGIVPYQDLGLPASFVKDGYHHWFTYIVDDYFSTFPTHSYMPIAHQPVSKLCEKNKHTNALYVRGNAENIALALISHGPEGRGAYHQPLSPSPQGRDEIQNCTSDREIIDRPFTQNPLNPFSHKVVWVTPQNLLALYGHAPCPLVEVPTLPSTTRYQPPQFPSGISKDPAH